MDCRRKSSKCVTLPLRLTFANSMRFRLFWALVVGLFTLDSFAQCELFDGNGVMEANPTWVSCSGGDFTLFIQSNTTFGAYTVDWGDGSPLSTGTGLVPPNFISHTYTATTANYTVVFTETATGCVVTGLVVMEEPVNASIQIPIGGVTQVCAPGTIEFTNSSTDVSSNTVFTWDFGDGSPILTFGDTNAGQTIEHTYEQNTVNCVTAVTLTAENFCSFGNPTTAVFNPIQVFDIDDAQVTASEELLCYPDTVVHFDNTTNRNCVPQGNTVQRYEYWNFGDYWGQGVDSIIDWQPFLPPNRPGYDIAYPGIGTYTVMMIDSNQCGQDTAYVTVEIVDQPTAAVSSSDDTVCTGENITFFNNSFGGSNQHRINFGDGTGWFNINNSRNKSYNTAGTYTVLLAANINGGSASCTDTTSMQVVVLPSPDVDFSLTPAAACDSLTVSFVNTSTGGIQYDWDFDNGNTSTLQNPAPEFYGTPGAYTVTLTVTSSNGCVSDDTEDVNVYQTPVADFTAQNVCEDELASFIDNTTTGFGGGITSWLWSFGDAGNSTTTLQNPTFTYVDSGTFVISLAVTTANCTDTISDTISVEPRPIAAFTESDSVGCSPLPVMFTDFSTGAVNFFWDFGDGTTSMLQNPTHTFLHNGLTDTTFVVKLVSSSAFGCADSIYDTITVQGNPVAQFSSTAILDCAPLEVQFTDSSTGGVSVLWDFGDGSGSTLNNPAHTFQNTTQFITNYTVELAVIAANGCTDTATDFVTVYPEPLFNFNIVPDSGCSPLDVQFPVAVGAVVYDWDFGDGTTANGPSPSHTFVNNTTNDLNFTVQLIATSPFGCVDTVTGNVLVFPNPTAALAPVTAEGCEPLTVNFVNGSTGGTSFEWDFDDGNTSTSGATNLSHTYVNATNDTLFFDASLIAITDDGCRDTAFADIGVYRRVEASFSVPTDTCHPFTPSLTDLSTNPFAWSWDFDDGNTSTVQNPTHNFANTSLVPIVFDVNLEVANLEGCTDDTTISTQVFPKPTADFAPSDTAGCEPFDLVVTNNSVLNQQNFWDFGDGTTSTTAAGTINLTYPNPSNLPIVRTIELMVENQYGCRDTTSADVDVYSQIFASFAVPTVGCHPFTVTFSDSSINAVQYNWDFDDGATSAVSGPTHTFSNTTTAVQTFDVTLTVTNAEGCTDDSTITITVYPKPTAAFALSQNVGCEPLVVNFTNNSVLNQLNFWDLGDGTQNTSNATNFSHTYPNPTNTPIIRTVELMVENQFGCRDTLTEDIQIHSQIHADFSAPLEGCHPFNVNFTDLSTNAVQYDWDFGDGTLSNQTTPFHQFVNTTNLVQTFDVTMLVTNAEGCTDQITQTVTVHPKPSAGFQMSTNLGCEPLIVTFTNVSVLNDSSHWDFDNGLTSTSNGNSVQTTYTNPTNFAAFFDPELIVTTTFGCMDTFTNQLEVHPQIIAGFIIDSAICHPFNAQVQDLSVNAAQYDYDFGDMTGGSTQANPGHLYNNFSNVLETYTATQTVTNAEGCQDIATITVDVFPKPVSQFSIVSSPACHGEPVSILNQSTLNDINIWTVGNNGFPAIQNDPQIDTFFLNFTTNPQDIPFTLVVENNFGCRDTSESSITVFPEVEARFTVPDEGCSPFEATFTNLSSGGSLFTWDFGDGNQSFDDAPVHVFENTGDVDVTYQVVLTVTSQFNCTSTDTIPVLVRPKPDVLFTATPLTQRFPDATISLTNLTNPGPWSYAWDFADSTTSNEQSPGSHTYDTWGEYRVMLTGSTQFCEDTHSVLVIVEPPFPIADFELDTSGCAPVTIDFVNLSQYGVEFLWDFGDGGRSSSENPTYTYSFPGSYTVQLTVTGPGGQTSVELIVAAVEVFEQPVANFVYTPETVTVPTEPVNFINYSLLGDQYLWNFGDTNTSTAENPQHLYREPGTYFPELVVSNSFGCSDTFKSEIPLLASETGDVQVPNAFTPSSTGGNGGLYDPLSFDNHVFFPVVAGVTEEEYLLSIYNRWGELIFETDELSRGWDGYYRGKICQQDVYVWKMKGQYVNGTKFSKVGDVTLLR